MRLVTLLALSILTSAAWAAPSMRFLDFQWHRNSRFELTLEIEGQEAEFSGHLPLNGETTARSGVVQVDLKGYIEGFVAIATSSQQDDQAQIIVLEYDGNKFVSISNRPIPANRNSALADFDATILALKNANGWGTAISIRQVADYFGVGSTGTLGDFLSAAQRGEIKVLAKPTPAVSLAQQPIPPREEQYQEQPPPRPQYPQPQYPEPPPNGGGYYYRPW